MIPLVVNQIVECRGDDWVVTKVHELGKGRYSYDLHLAGEPTTTWYGVRDHTLEEGY